MNTVKFSTILVLLGALFAFSACKTPTAIAPEESAFIADFPSDELQPSERRENAFVWRKPGIDLSSYEQVIVDPLQEYIEDDPESEISGKEVVDEARRASPEEFENLRNQYREAYVAAMGGFLPVVNEPGPKTLRMRSAITHLVSGDPDLAVVTSLPIIGYVNIIQSLETGRSLGVGQAEVQIEVLDSMTNERMMVFTERRIGKKRDLDKAFTRWGHVNQAFEEWALFMREELELARTGEPASAPDAE